MDTHRQALYESLSTHFLEGADWIVPIILTANLDEISMARLIVLFNKKLSSGHAAKRLNDTIDHLLQHKDADRLRKLLSLSVGHIFPELYMNPYLETHEKDIVEKVLDREICIVLAILQLKTTKKHYLPFESRYLPSEYDHRHFEKGTLYEDNHKMVCFNNNELASPFIEDEIIIYDTNESYKVKRDLLLNYFSHEKYVNPATKKYLSESVKNALLEKYCIEIHLRQGSFAKPSEKIKTPPKKIPTPEKKSPLPKTPERASSSSLCLTEEEIQEIIPVSPKKKKKSPPKKKITEKAKKPVEEEKEEEEIIIDFPQDEEEEIVIQKDPTPPPPKKKTTKKVVPPSPEKIIPITKRGKKTIPPAKSPVTVPKETTTTTLATKKAYKPPSRQKK